MKNSREQNKLLASSSTPFLIHPAAAVIDRREESDLSELWTFLSRLVPYYYRRRWRVAGDGREKVNNLKTCLVERITTAMEHGVRRGSWCIIL